MAFLTAHFYGDSIKKHAGLNIILPPGKGPFPVMYLLHGLSDDYTIWVRRTSIERYVAEINLMVVMPDGGRSFYCNDCRPGGLAYEDHIVKDVVGFVDGTFRTIAGRSARAIAGLSMGGYGALMLAMKHPGLFSAACAHSSAVEFGHTSTSNPFFAELPDVLAIATGLPRDGRYDLFRLAQGLAKSRTRPTLRLDCGRDDFLIESNRAFHAHLKKTGYRHEYREPPGSHTWDYWDLHIRESIAFVMKNLRVKKR